MSEWIRRIHRWLSIAFTAGVIVNIVMIATLKGDEPPFWVYLLPLGPLALLLPTGLYMFAQPYVARMRGK
ncbi:MAG: hypothetical protein ABL957_12945 [Parvularculaceae bacterium]